MESFVNVGACVSVANLQMIVFSVILAGCLGFIFYSAQFSAVKRKFLFRFAKRKFPFRFQNFCVLFSEGFWQLHNESCATCISKYKLHWGKCGMESFVNVGVCVSVANLQMIIFSVILAGCLGFIFYSA